MLAVGTRRPLTVNHGRAAFAWFTAVPGAFVLVTTICAAVLSTLNVYWPMAHHAGTEAQGWVQVGLMSAFVFGAAVVIVSTSVRCVQTLRGIPPPNAQAPSLDDGHVSPQPAAPFRCC